MGDTFPVALSKSLEALQDGSLTLQECVERYPEYKKLPSMLDVGNQITFLPYISPAVGFQEASRARILKHLMEKKKKAVPAFSFARTPAFAAMMMLLLAIVFTGNRVAYASSSALPGDTLYRVKTVYEEIQLYSSDNVEDVSLHMQYAEVRLDEVQQLTDTKRYGSIIVAVNGFEHHTEMAYRVLETVMLENPARGADLAEFVEEKSAVNINTLLSLASVVPSESQPVIQQALVVAVELSSDDGNLPVGGEGDDASQNVNHPDETGPDNGDLPVQTGNPDNSGKPEDSGNAGQPDDPGSNNGNGNNGNGNNGNGNNGNGNNGNGNNGNSGNNGNGNSGNSSDNGNGNSGNNGNGNSGNSGDNGNGNSGNNGNGNPENPGSGNSGNNGNGNSGNSGGGNSGGGNSGDNDDETPGNSGGGNSGNNGNGNSGGNTP